MRTRHEVIRLMIPSRRSDALSSNYVSDWRGHSSHQEQHKTFRTKLIEEYPGIVPLITYSPTRKAPASSPTIPIYTHITNGSTGLACLQGTGMTFLCITATILDIWPWPVDLRLAITRQPEGMSSHICLLNLLAYIRLLLTQFH